LKAKECSKCKKMKPIDEFAKFIRGKNGHRAQCKACDSDYREQRGLRIPMEDVEYKVNAETMKNHMFLHFGFWESKKASNHNHMSKELRKYYKPEQSDKI
jgi:NAD-dependent SIR2 family protein deacetylase